MKLENMMMMGGWFVNNVDKSTNIHLSKSCMPHLRANSTLTFINQWQSVKKLGATVVLVGDAYDKAQAYAKKRAMEEGRTFIPPFDHLDVIMGQGTVGMEVMRQMKGPLKAIFVPVGAVGL